MKNWWRAALWCLKLQRCRCEAVSCQGCTRIGRACWRRSTCSSARRLSYEMWAMGLEERTCAPKEHYGNSRLCKALGPFKSLLLDLRCPKARNRPWNPESRMDEGVLYMWNPFANVPISRAANRAKTGPDWLRLGETASFQAKLSI